MKKNILRILAFVLTMAFLVAILKTINWLPTAIEQGTLRKYDSIEDAKTKLSIKGILVPSYFPQNLSWPPSEILAQTVPFTAVIMECRSAPKGDVSLVLSQAASPDFDANTKIRISQVREKVTYPLKGRNATLLVGTCGKEVLCSRIYWNEGKYRVDIAMKSAPFDLLKIAESMVQQ